MELQLCGQALLHGGKTFGGLTGEAPSAGALEDPWKAPGAGATRRTSSSPAETIRILLALRPLNAASQECPGFIAFADGAPSVIRAPHRLALPLCPWTIVWV